MSTQKTLGLVVLGSAAFAFVLGGCASTQKDARAEGGKIPYAINKDLTRGYSLAEDQMLTARDREIYRAERYNDVYPEHLGTLGSPPAGYYGDGRLWHWGY